MEDKHTLGCCRRMQCIAAYWTSTVAHATTCKVNAFLYDLCLMPQLSPFHKHAVALSHNSPVNFHIIHLSPAQLLRPGVMTQVCERGQQGANSARLARPHEPLARQHSHPGIKLGRQPGERPREKHLAVGHAY